MIKKLSLKSFRFGGLLAMTALLAACAATTTPATSNQTPKYSSQECKQMHGRGVINLDQYKKCVHGQPFDTMKKPS